MKFFIFIVISCFASFSCLHAQDTKPSASDTVIISEIEEIYPAEDESIPVDMEPFIDMEELHSYIVYDEIARRAGIEGKVIIKLLINEKGEFAKYKVKYSDAQLLDKAVVNAIKQTKNIKPAMKDNKPVAVWVTIPITFELIDPVKK